jgi:hypothetical protein
MKKIIAILLMFSSAMVFGQKKENGKIYIEHPAINVVADFTKAMVNGDTTAMKSLMTDDFRAFIAVTASPYTKGTDKAAYLRNAMFWKENLDYYSIETMRGSYPDAFEYAKDPSDNNAVTVESWDILKGVHKKTGVKADMLLHRSFTLTKGNKIRRVMNYMNPEFGSDVRAAFSTRKNGTIYNEHEHINTLRLIMAAFEHNDLDKYYSFFHPKASFNDINNPDFKVYTMKQNREKLEGLFEGYEVHGMEQVGYPDYMHYEMGDSGVLYSWWNLHVTRKSDKKDIKVPMHFQHNVDDEGKIVNIIAYYNGTLFN